MYPPAGQTHTTPSRIRRERITQSLCGVVASESDLYHCYNIDTLILFNRSRCQQIWG